MGKISTQEKKLSNWKSFWKWHKMESGNWKLNTMEGKKTGIQYNLHMARTRRSIFKVQAIHVSQPNLQYPFYRFWWREWVGASQPGRGLDEITKSITNGLRVPLDRGREKTLGTRLVSLVWRNPILSSVTVKRIWKSTRHFPHFSSVKFTHETEYVGPGVWGEHLTWNPFFSHRRAHPS